MVKMYAKFDESSTNEGKWDKIGIEKTITTSCVDTVLCQTICKKRERKKVVTTENVKKVHNELLWSPEVAKSHQHFSYSLGITPSSIYAILKELNEDDHDRLQFAKFGMISQQLS